MAPVITLELEKVRIAFRLDLPLARIHTELPSAPANPLCPGLNFAFNTRHVARDFFLQGS